MDKCRHKIDQLYKNGHKIQRLICKYFPITTFISDQFHWDQTSGTAKYCLAGNFFVVIVCMIKTIDIPNNQSELYKDIISITIAQIVFCQFWLRD